MSERTTCEGFTFKLQHYAYPAYVEIPDWIVPRALWAMYCPLPPGVRPVPWGPER